MPQRIKTINRNIANSKKCRCKYDEPTKFDILRVNISFNGETVSYQVDSKDLSPNKDSIYFYPSINNGSLEIQWNKEIADHIYRI